MESDNRPIVLTLALVAAFGAGVLVAPHLQAGAPDSGVAGASGSPGPYSSTHVEVSAGGVELSIPRPDRWGSWDWKLPGANHLTQNTTGSDRAEVVFAWVIGDIGLPCNNVGKEWAARTSAELTDTFASAGGVDVVAGPEPTTVDGRSATHLVLQVRDDVGCDPGFFFSWPWWQGGELWNETIPGDTIRIWTLDVGRGGPLVLLGISRDSAPDAVVAQFQAIIDGIRISGA